MLRRAAVSQVKSGEVTRELGHIVVTMRVYPRFLPRSLVDEYVRSLSPDVELFERYRELKKRSGDQDSAFEAAGYQKRFRLSDEALKELERLSALSSDRDVFLVCQCAPKERCHVDLMLRVAERRFRARIGESPHEYPDFDPSG